MFNLSDAVKSANYLGVKFDNYSIQDYLTGMNIELEHGKVNMKTNVTNDCLITTSKIALAHLNEFSNYYNKEYGLPALEEELKRKQLN